jgi:flavin-dependent dehydrogenase
MREVDVAIMGGGLAGNLLARQLRLEVPDASVALFERRGPEDPPAYKVGESTVEIAAHYLVKRQRLSTYVYKEHLPKFGLRYFFDTPDKDTELMAMSEIGTRSAPLYPSFQLDRARLETDLLAMNEADGVAIHRGARVRQLDLGGDRHRLRVRTAEGEEEIAARWVIDGTGRESLLARMKGLRVPETSHRMAAGWGRFHGVADIDGLGGPDWPDAEAFHARAHHSSRVLATNHFMHDGYWIWFIPLREGLTSLGLVQDARLWGRDRHSMEGFLAYLRQHRAVASLLEGVEGVDYEAWTQLAFRTKQFFSADRWACIGDAAAFADPFYSPGSDFIALENDLVADLIRRELAGEDIAERTAKYDDFMQYRFDTTMVIYDGLYSTFGSYELFRAKVYFDTAVYYNLLFDAFAREQHRDLRWVRSELRRKVFGMELMENFRRMFAAAAEEMKAKGTYYAHNRGHHVLDAFEAFGLLKTVGVPRKRREVAAANEAIFTEVQRRLTAVLGPDSDVVRSFGRDDRGLYDAWTQLSQ